MSRLKTEQDTTVFSSGDAEASIPSRASVKRWGPGDDSAS